MGIDILYAMDHNMNLPCKNGSVDIAIAEKTICKYLGDSLEIIHWKDEHYAKTAFPEPQENKPWTLKIDHQFENCTLIGPCKTEAYVYPHTFIIDIDPEEKATGYMRWYRFAEEYFLNHNPQIRSWAHADMLKLKEIFKIFSPSVLLFQGDCYGFDAIWTPLSEGLTLQEALSPGGFYEKSMADLHPKGFKLLSEKDSERVDYGSDYCPLLFQPLDEIQ